MANLPQITGAKKRGVLLLDGPDDLGKLEGHLINDTVCIEGPQDFAFALARTINEKYKVAVKIAGTQNLTGELPADIEVINSPIQEIVGEGQAEAVKFKNGKVIGVCLVLIIAQQGGEA